MIARIILAAALFLAAPAMAESPARATNTPAARGALEHWAACIAQRNTAEAARVLQMDFTTSTYDRALLMLSRESKDCTAFRGTLRAGGLLFAGELAEALIEQQPGGVRTALARAAAAAPPRSFSFTDKVAICAVRSAPDDVAALFATERDSDEEATALRQVSATMAACSKAAEATKPLSINPAGMRAMLATAAFRSVASMKDA
ncbi:hypothetical protein [Novosphingobium aquimarinum]|uniref:hypothetical protein n=1 Tax=Novosphingobium aquimarinum TaxID=2682494 RepID=UPI0012EBF4FD|nr:hypothetical protein [Novosphingobium aquimarinum]